MINSLITKINKTFDKRTSLQKSVDWIKNNRIPGSGIVVHHRTKLVTPEVTGYIIDSLYRVGEKELAYDLARWEASVQRKDGGVLAPGSAVAYTFDTAQLMRGYLAVLDDMPELLPNLVAASDYVESHIDAKGEVLHDSYDLWKLPDGSVLSEYGNLYVLPALLQAGEKLNEKRYIKAARRSMDYYRTIPDLVEFKPKLSMLSHYLGYMSEALVDMGEVELANKALEQASRIQDKNGAIPAYPGASWICSTGIAQLGIAWAKLGDKAQAEKCLNYLESIQNPSGGFYGGYGEKVEYFDRQEISWACKFFIDLHLLVRGQKQ